MATIGTFSKSETGYTGSIKTLNLNVKANIVPTEANSERSPNYRIFAGNVEIGAGWNQTGRDSGRSYVSVKLDDPSLPAPIFASLIKSEDQEGFTLIWSRRPGE